MRELLLSKGLVLQAQRIKTPYAELDLVFSKNKTLFIIEVKTLKSLNFLPTRIQDKQRRRLRNAVFYFSENTNYQIRLIWAFVLSDGQVRFIEEGFY